MQEGPLLMTQPDRDRLVTLKKAKKKLITQREAAEELGLSVRHVQCRVRIFHPALLHRWDSGSLISLRRLDYFS
jgi:hypothetical protein